MLGSGLGSNMLDSGVAIPVWLRGWEAMLQQWALELEVFGGTCVKKEVSAQLYHLGHFVPKPTLCCFKNPITPQTVWLFISVSCGSLMAQLSYCLHSCLLTGSVEVVHGMALKTP